MHIETLFRENFRALTVYALQFVRDKAMAEDIVQELFVSLVEKEESMEGRNLAKSYLYKAVHNRCLNHIRDQKLKRELDPVIRRSMGDLPEDPHELAAFVEFQEKYLRVLEELPPKCRRVFELSRVEGRGNQEVADILKLSRRTVEKHIQLALKRLRRKLFQYMNVLSTFLL